MNRCTLCPHNCTIFENETGICGMRKNINGKLVDVNYGKISSIALDPIEKKPLYMFHPGTHILSIGSFGCNFHCPFCQNYDISLAYKESLQSAEYFTPKQIVDLAKKTIPDGNIGVAYTYNEPFIGYEFSYDCSAKVHEAGLLNVIVTNGYINREPLEAILPNIDAMNIDLKGFSEDFYKKVGGHLKDVKKTIEFAQRNCHVEVTTLIIPGENDSAQEIAELSSWLASLDPDIPLHLTRFFPRHKYSGRTPTPPEIIYKLREVAKEHLRNVFIGNC